MKAIVLRLVLFCLIFVLPIMVLSACGGGSLSAPQNGTYRADDGLLEGWLAQTWTFSGTNDITLSTAGGLINTRGTWRIDGDRLYITTTMFGSETTSRYLITEITRNSFFIDGAKFVRQ